jgi:hypothetical protein
MSDQNTQPQEEQKLIEDVEHAHPETKMIEDVDHAHPEIEKLEPPEQE